MKFNMIKARNFPLGILVLSLDVELAWGLFYRAKFKRYQELYDQERPLFRRLLPLLEESQWPVTFAFVGHLLLANCRRVQGQAHPEVLAPDYSWYPHPWHHADPCSNYENAPWWYAPDLAEQVVFSKVEHELASHTFSHIICDDPACTGEIFTNQLQVCQEVTRAYGRELKTLIFPENRIAHLAELESLGFISFRGREAKWYSDLPGEKTQRAVVGLERWLSLPPKVYGPADLKVPGHRLVNLAASMRLYSTWGGGRFIPMSHRRQQLLAGLRRARREQKMFHLWCHPHDLATDSRIMDLLEDFIEAVGLEQQKGNVLCQTMAQVAEMVLPDLDNP
jgi:peptidoglycan/xylan/chitin deacetylase (PgdA/CDA1 family)